MEMRFGDCARHLTPRFWWFTEVDRIVWVWPVV